MATKKQKRQAGLAKHEAYMAELKRSGLEAQRKDRTERARQHLIAQEKIHQQHHRFEDWCLHCTIIKKAIARGQTHKDAQELIEFSKRNRRTDDSPNGVLSEKLRDISFADLDAADRQQMDEELADAASLEMECI